MAMSSPVLGRLIRVALRHKQRFFWTNGVMIAAAIGTAALPTLIGWIINSGLKLRVDDGISTAAASWGVLSLMCGLLFVTAIARGALAYGQAYLGESLSQRVAYDLRNTLYDHLQQLSFGFHDKAQVGEIMQRATQDIEGIRMFVQMGVTRLVFITLLIILSVGLIALENMRVGLIVIALIPIIGIYAGVMSLRMRPIWLGIVQMQGQLGIVLQENLVGQRVVKAFSRQEFEQSKFDDKVDKLYLESYRTTKYMAFNEPFLQGAWLVAVALVFWVGIKEIQADRLLPGDLIKFQIYLVLLQVPVRALGFVVNIVARAFSCGRRLFELLDQVSPVKDGDNATDITPGPGDVIFEGVSFEYDPNRTVLEEINIHAKPGQTVALLGPTGSGKTSIVHLLPRFYDATQGRVLIDGEDVRDVTLNSLRQAVGLVQQDVFLFSATIRENLAYGKPDATDEEIIAAAQAARLHDYIVSQPDGYDTWVGERGSTLSGGQRQRVAIARTLLLDPRILIFDDSTAAVDMRTEYLIQEALRTLMAGRTTFLIAQRLRTVREADQILVMRDGKIVERGKHEELLAANGFYREIYDLELKDQEDASVSQTGRVGE